MLPLIPLPVSTGDAAADRIRASPTIKLLSKLQSELEHGNKNNMYAIINELERRSAQNGDTRKYVAQELEKIGVRCKGTWWLDNTFRNCEYSPKLDFS